MTIASDTFVTGTVVAARLAPEMVDTFDPIMRRLLCGQQFFVKLADGRWCPQGCSLGLPAHFDFSDLLAPVPRD
jgi:hypothetical protein